MASAVISEPWIMDYLPWAKYMESSEPWTAISSVSEVLIYILWGAPEESLEIEAKTKHPLVAGYSISFKSMQTNGTKVIEQKPRFLELPESHRHYLSPHICQAYNRFCLHNFTTFTLKKNA